VASLHLIAHQGGLVLEAQLDNGSDAAVHLNAWQPLAVDPETGGSLHLVDHPEQASVLINGFQSWDYAGIHALLGDRDGAAPSHQSWWTAAVCDPRTDAMFVAQVLKASRYATVFSLSWPDHLLAEQRGAPFAVAGEERTGLPEPLRLEVPAHSGVISDPILLLFGQDGTATLRTALELAGRASGRLAYPVVPRGWCSWYHLGLAVTAADIERHAAFVAEKLPQLAKTLPKPYRPIIQVDDGWMPRWQRWGDWMANEFFSHDLRHVAGVIRRHRLDAGIWLAPFHVAADSQLAGAHPDWLVHSERGQPLVDPRLSRAYHLLDATHPQVQAFLGELFLSLRRDGYTYFKIDFLYGGGYEGRRFRERVTGTEALRLGLQHIAEAVNPPGQPERCFILACGAPLLPIAGLVHGARIGGDVGAPRMEDGKAAEPMVGFPFVLWMARNQAARLFTDRTLYAVDADVVMVNSQLSMDEARVMVTIAALSGGVYLYSDDLERLPEERLQLLRNPNVLALVGSPAAEPLHLFGSPERNPGNHWLSMPEGLPAVWARREPGGAAIVAMYNWANEPAEITVRLADVIGSDQALQVRDLWSPRRGGRSLGAHRGMVRMAMAPHSVRLLRMESAGGR
jgi:alpha-galactosidase